MNIFDTLRISSKAIVSNKLRSGLTVLGIVIGVTSVIILISLVTGLKSFITDTISSLGPNVMFVIPGQIGGARGPGGSQINRLTLQDSLDLQMKLLDSAAVSAVVQKVTKVSYQNKDIPDTNINGVQTNYSKIIESVKITDGRFFNASEADSGKRVAVIGPSVRDKLYGSSNPLNKDILIGTNKYTVVGVTNSRGSSFGVDMDNIAIIPLVAAQKQFGDSNVSFILVSANSSDTVNQVQAKTQDILSKRLSPDDFTVQTQEQTLSTVSQITGVLTIALGGIAAISLLVGGIGIMNIMLVTVTERTKEIGLRKALGAQAKDIRNQFLVEALTLSGLGGVIGIVLGLIFSQIANKFITTTTPLWAILLSFGFSVVVGVIFGVAPAIKASKLDPIQALRYE